MLFSTHTYMQRRAALKQKLGSGLVIFWGNNPTSYNYPNNTCKHRQDSSFLYYFGQPREGLVAVIDIDNDTEYLFGDDIDVEDIVWYGTVRTVADMAAEAGVAKTGAMSALQPIIAAAQKANREILFLPPYRHDVMIQIMDLLKIHPSAQREAASLRLIKAVIDQRAVKSAEEIEELTRACDIGYEMHTTAMRMCRPGITEQEIAGAIEGIAQAKGNAVSFSTILTMHGEILHGMPTTAPLEAGRLMLCDAGVDSNNFYASDHTRTSPISGKFTQQQREIYQIVAQCHDHVMDIAKPGVKWWDVHFSACRMMVEGLKDLGLMMGDTEEALQAGAHAFFMPHGIGHMIGMDVHDMEGLGQTYVGFDDEVRPNLTQFGTCSLRCGRRLQEGWVMSDEPGIYFIPDLYADWRKKGLHTAFIHYDRVAQYLDFGGIRIEDDVHITAAGSRFLGNKIIPYQIQDVEDFIAQNR